MNYSKPEVNTLGKAKAVIESLGKNHPPVIDGGPTQFKSPAYDLDE